MIEAPSDPGVVYKNLGDAGLYLRSEDHGITWRLPEYRIGSETKEQFAATVSGKSFYRVDFWLAAIHPREPLTLYAAIRVIPWAIPIPRTTKLVCRITMCRVCTSPGTEERTGHSSPTPWNRWDCFRLF